MFFVKKSLLPKISSFVAVDSCQHHKIAARLTYLWTTPVLVYWGMLNNGLFHHVIPCGCEVLVIVVVEKRLVLPSVQRKRESLHTKLCLCVIYKSTDRSVTAPDGDLSSFIIQGQDLKTWF